MIYYGVHDVLVLYLTAFTSNDALNLLEECEFPINSKWEKLARNMDISLDERCRLRALAITQDLNYGAALEMNFKEPEQYQLLGICSYPEWKMLISSPQQKLGITATPSKHHYNIIIITLSMSFNSS